MRTRPHRSARAGIVAMFAVAMFGGASSASAAQCAVSMSGVAFGAYDTFSASAADSTGSVIVACDATTSYSLALSTGVSGNFNRTLAWGANRLNYNLYVDATRSVVWGDGSVATSRVAGSGLGATHTVYGRMPARQNVPAGSYSDSLVVTVEF